jgi:hypothetical protein
MTDDRLPSHPDEIDARWLTDVLARRHPGVRVRDVEVLEIHEVTNTHARLHLHYDEPAGAPETMFCKLPPLQPERRATIAATTMGVREARFYDTLADRLGLRVPGVHVARHDERDGSFVLLLEDLTATGCRVSDGTWGIPPDSAARALEELAELHARYEDPATQAAEVPWIPTNRWGSTYGSTMLQHGLDHHRHRLSDDFAAIARIYIDDGERLHHLWHDGPKTVIHGDTHIGNLFLDGDRCGFLDWGIINVGVTMREVGYFLTMAMDPPDRRAHERELIRLYLAARRANGGRDITFDDAWAQHRRHAAYTVPASCQIVVFPEGISERRRIFSEAFLARAEAAIADLEALEALHEAGL